MFAQWLSSFDPAHEVPPRGLLPGAYKRARPHIYTDAEIGAIIAAAKVLPSIYGLRGLTCSTLFGLIAVTGLRIDDIGFSFLGPPGAAPSTLMVRYLATGSRRGAAVLSRLCVAPIYEGATYHYGLFLLATQLRMAGGFASGRRLDESVNTPAPFEVAFGIPLTDSFGV